MPSTPIPVCQNGVISAKNKLLTRIAVLLLLLIAIPGFRAVRASEIPDPGKTYLIFSAQTGKALQVADAGVENLANIEVSVPHGGISQSWRFKPAGRGYPDNTFSLVSVKSGRVLDVMGYSREDGANVQLFKYYGTKNQRWRIIPAGNDSFRIVSINSGKCLDAENTGKRETANVRQFSCGAGGHQLWKLKPNPQAGRIFRIVCKKSGKALDIAGSSSLDGANIELFRSHGRANQLWTLWHHGFRNGVPTYAIVSYHSGRVLDVDGKSRNDGANVQQFRYRANDNQHWILEPAEGEFVRIISVNSGKCLDAAGGITDDGANIRQFTCNGEEHQLWELQEVSLP
ncbi:MAG: RICIN domain-containing protein [Desulfococcaceae bacterium]